MEGYILEGDVEYAIREGHKLLNKQHILIPLLIDIVSALGRSSNLIGFYNCWIECLYELTLECKDKKVLLTIAKITLLYRKAEIKPILELKELRDLIVKWFPSDGKLSESGKQVYKEICVDEYSEVVLAGLSHIWSLKNYNDAQDSIDYFIRKRGKDNIQLLWCAIKIYYDNREDIIIREKLFNKKRYGLLIAPVYENGGSWTNVEIEALNKTVEWLNIFFKEKKGDCFDAMFNFIPKMVVNEMDYNINEKVIDQIKVIKIKNKKDIKR